MPKDVTYGKTVRKSFARSNEIQDMPNLLEIQKDSYKWFLETGLKEVFRDVAAITDYTGNLELTFINYKMDEKPKYTVEECKARDATYAAPLKVSVCLRNKETEEIKLTTNIQEDLEADSLDLFQIINEIEDEFDVKIETEDGIKTVQDLVTYVEKQTA